MHAHDERRRAQPGVPVTLSVCGPSGLRARSAGLDGECKRGIVHAERTYMVDLGVSAADRQCPLMPLRARCGSEAEYAAEPAVVHEGFR